MRLSSELAKGGIVLFISSNLFNLLNLIFNFTSARLLGAISYGTLATLMSLVFIFSVPNETIHTIISRYSTKFYVEKDSGKIKNLLVKALKKFSFLSLICFIIFFLLSEIIGNFLSIDRNLLIFTGLGIFGVFLIPITRGILQGTKKFRELGATYISEGSFKLIIAVFLIVIGLGVYGAITGVILGTFLGFLLSLISLKEVLSAKRKKVKVGGIYSYSFPALVSIASIMIFFSLDIILAKAFFNPELAGQYAAISNLGKVIFLGTWGISKAMFPLISERHDKKAHTSRLLEQSFLTVFFISLGVLFLYFLFPEQIINVLYGKDYIAVSGLLIYPALSMAILSLTNIFVLFNLCINKPKRNYLTVFFVLLQIILLSLFHSSLLQFSIMLLISNMLLLMGIVAVNISKM